MQRFQAHRAIATLHSFRFFGLVFILPGVVGHLPSGFATYHGVWRLRDWTAGPASPSHRTIASAVLVLRGRLQSRRRQRYPPRLLPRHPGRSPCNRWGVRLCLCHPHPLRAAAHDHAHRRYRLAGAFSTQRNREFIRECKRGLEHFHKMCTQASQSRGRNRSSPVVPHSD